MIEVKESKQKDDCKYAEYDADGKHCEFVALKQCPYIVEENCPDYVSSKCMKETKTEDETRTAGVQLDLEKISFADLKKLEYMVDEELKSRRSELDAMIDDFRKPLEALLSSNKVSIYCNVDEGEVKSFFDFSFCEK